MCKDITITIVAYKNYSDIKKAIESIEIFTNPDISKTIYIVDNSCLPENDNNRMDFEKFLSNYSDIVYVYADSNLGFGKGHNLVINKLDSKYHAIVNPDIILKGDVFSSIIKYMDSDNSIGMCIPKIVNENGEIQPVYRREITVIDMFIRMFCKKMFKKRQAYHTMQDMDYSKPFQVPFGQGSFLVIKTNLFKQLNGFDDRYFMYLEDADLCRQVNKVSKLMYYPGATVIHKWEKASHKSLKLLMIHLSSMIKYFKKYRKS